MPSINKNLQTYYTPSNINQYKEVLENFEWNLFLTDNYYPSLDSIHKFLFQLTRNGKEWEDTYYQICNQKINEYNKKVVQKEEKVVEKEEKLKRKPQKNNKKKSISN
jgi:alpha-galactosidase/6-phospho-beta-glucosidase family protein